MKKIIKIETIEVLDNALKDKKAIIFKNSPRCPISAGTRLKYEDYASKCDINVNFYMIDVITGRNISEELSIRTGIRHESPQAIILINGKPVWNKSHYDINLISLEEAFLKNMK